MSRYTTRGYLDWEWLTEDPIFRETPVVPEHVATATGILTSSGEMIYKQPRPISFMRDGEW